MDIKNAGLKSFRDIHVDETNILTWQGLIVPVSIIIAKKLSVVDKFIN